MEQENWRWKNESKKAISELKDFSNNTENPKRLIG